MKKRVISLFLAVVMIVGMIPLGAISAFAEEKTDNQYVVRSWDGTKVTEQFVDIPAATTVTSTATVWENGWYVADGTVDLSSARVGGDVNLILMDGCKLTVGGIVVTGSDSLTIYAQKGGTGELISKASADNYAGIGGGSKDDGGIIAIHGGKITATGGNMAAGIGGGFQGACGDVVIYGGEVTAAGGFNGAGIGTGSAPRNNGGSIAIYGGKVTVSTSDNSAMGDQRPRAIGGGFNGSVDTITIGIIMEVSDGSGNIVTAPSGEQTWADVLTGICYTFCLPVVEYLVADGKSAKCDTYTPVTKDTKTWTSGYYVVNEDVEISGDIKISGVVNLILTDGKTLTVDGGMLSDSDLSIYAQSNGEKMGKLNSNGVIQSSGKGSIYIYGGSVTTTNYILGNGGVSIIGGVVTANGHAYGIASNGDIIIKGKVTATGDDSAIWSTGNITLYGEVSATGGMYGICSKGTTTIYGKVSATGENAGIFAERECWIVYGSVTAVGGEFGVECVTNGIRIYESGNTTISGNVRAIKGNGHEIETVEVYNRANERVFNPNETLWDKVLTDTYYRFVPEGSVVPYRYYDIESGEFKDDVYFGCEVIDEYTTEWEIPENNDEKWYAVKGEPVINGNVMVSGEVHLILTDESTLTVNGTISGENAYLYLHSQSTGNNTGKLECKGKDGKDGDQLQGSDLAENGNPAIHVKELTVDGSAIMAIGGNGGIGRTSRNYAGDSGANGGDAVISDKITLNAATVTATGGTGGRGGGGTSSIGKGGIGGDAIKVKEVTINGGTVTATGGTGGITSERDGNAVGGIAVSFEETFEVNGGEITLTGGSGGEGLELNNGERGSIGNYAVSGGKLIINSGKVSATGGTGGNGGNGGSDPRGAHDGWGGAAGNGGIAIGVESLVLNSGTITATGGMGGNGGIARNLDRKSDNSGGTGGNGAIAVSCQTELTVKDGILTANGGNGGAGGKTINDVYAPSGAVGASISLDKDCVIEGAVTVKANEGDEYTPLPSGKSISDYQFAKIANTPHTHDFTGDYVNNGDGTHSRKCTGCDEYSTPENHTYKDGVCVCGVYESCAHEDTETVLEWNEDFCCTATVSCKKCHKVVDGITRAPDSKNFVLEYLGDCQHKTKGHFVFDHKKFGYSESETFELYYGSHTDKNSDGICDDCEAVLTGNGGVFKSGIFQFIITDSDKKTVALISDRLSLIADSVDPVFDPYVSFETAYTGDIAIPGTVTYAGNTYTVTEIGYSYYKPFEECTELTSVTLPDTLLRINDGAFMDCEGLSEIVIPENVEEICETAFWGCNNIKTVIFISENVTQTPYGDFVLVSAFNEMNTVETVYVPAGMLDGYKTVWQCLANADFTEFHRYLDGDGSEKNIFSYGYITEGQTEYTSGWYLLAENAVFDAPVVINGDVKFILLDGATLTANKGILLTESNTLTVYAQSAGDDMGKIIATGNVFCTGIGSGFRQNAGDFTVNGGYVKATGGYAAKGIGGGFGGNDGTFTKNGGIVEAVNGEGYGSFHEHTYSTEWSVSESHHWHDATCEHTDFVSGFAAHTFGEGVADGNKTVYTCTECGYTKFVYNTASDEEGEIITGISYSGISLTLGSDIYINFYMNLNDGARQNGKMTFDIGGRIVTVDGKDAKYNEKEGKYYFRTPLTALEMAETVKATFSYNGVDYIQEYSVVEYIEAIVGGGDKYTAEMKTLAKKIANYGYYAQIYLESIHSNVDIVVSGIGYDRMEHFGEINVEEAKKALADHKTTVTGSSANLSLYGTTVYFDSATALNYYVTAKNGEKPTAAAVNTATGKSKEVEIKLYKKNIYIVSVKDITATELADNIEVTVNGEITFSGSVFAYCNSVVQAHTFDGATEKDAYAVNAMAAFYEYYTAAVEYAEASKSVYKVTFDNDSYCPRIYQDIKHGEKAHRPSDPMTANFVFDGWYEDEERTIPWNFDTPITEDTTIYGKWISENEFNSAKEDAKSQISNLAKSVKSTINSLNLPNDIKQVYLAEVDNKANTAAEQIENAKYTDKIQSIVIEAEIKINNILHNAEAAVIK